MTEIEHVFNVPGEHENENEKHVMKHHGRSGADGVSWFHGMKSKSLESSVHISDFPLKFITLKRYYIT